MVLKSFKEACKNLLINKTEITVLFIVPMLITLVICIELSGEYIKNIPMAVINYDQSELSRQIVSYFDQNELFEITYYPNSEQEMETLMKNSKVRAGMIIPKDFYKDITLLKSPTVMMLYDGSHMSITSAAKAKATEILLTIKTGAVIKNLTGRLNLTYEEAYNIAQAVQFNNRTLYNPSKSFKNFLIPILFAGGIQAALALTATVSVNQDIFEETRRKRLGYATGKILYYTLCGTLVFMCSMMIQIYLFKVPFAGNLMNALILSLGLCFSVSAVGVLLSILFKNRMIAMIAGALVFIPNSIMAGTTWPLMSMPVGYQGFAKYMPFAHFANNLRNIYLKGTSFQPLLKDLEFLLIFGAIVLILDEVALFLIEGKVNEKPVLEPGSV